MSRGGLLTVDAAVELLTNRKTRPHYVRVAAVTDRLADQSQRFVVANRVEDYWRPLPARAEAKARRGARRPVEGWGPGVQLGLFGEVGQ